MVGLPETTIGIDALRACGLFAGVGDDQLEALSREIRSITAHVQDLHFLDLPGRLAKRILREASDETPGADGSVRLPWPYTQSELAGMIGGSRQSVNRLLAELAGEGLIELQRDALVIPDPAALERSIRR